MKQVGKVPSKNHLSLSIALSASTVPPVPLLFPFISPGCSPVATQLKQYLFSPDFFSSSPASWAFSTMCLFFPVDGSVQFCFPVIILSPTWRDLVCYPFCKACVPFSPRGDHRRGNKGKNWWVMRGPPLKHLGRPSSLPLLLKQVYFIILNYGLEIKQKVFSIFQRMIPTHLILWPCEVDNTDLIYLSSWSCHRISLAAIVKNSQG